MPFLTMSRDLESPFQEVDRVVEAEHRIVILDIVFGKEIVEFVELIRIVEIDIRPTETGWKREWFRTNLVEGNVFLDGTIHIGWHSLVWNIE